MYVVKTLSGKEKVYTNKEAYEKLVEIETLEVQPLEVAGCIDEDEWKDYFKSFALNKLENEKVAFTKEDIETYLN